MRKLFMKFPGNIAEPNARDGGPLGSTMDALATKYYSDGTRKSLSYFAEYERIIGDRRNAPLRILELGVFSGASMLIWRDYAPNATIVGLDSAKAPPAAISGERRIHYISGLQDDPAALDAALHAAGGPLDLVVDDCSHIARVTKRSFNHLFPHVRPGGCYVIEDIGTSFLTGVFDDGQDFREPPMVDADPAITNFPSHTNGLIGVVKQLIDHVQRDVATRSHKVLPIEKVTIISNLAVIQKTA
jgi:hypothetical protein